METRKLYLFSVIFAVLFCGFSLAQEAVSVKTVGEPVVNTALVGIEPDQFSKQSNIDWGEIEQSITQRLSDAGLVTTKEHLANLPELILRISVKDFERQLWASHVQTSFARKVYLMRPRAVLKAEVWRVDVPVRFSDANGVNDAVMAEAVKQAEAFVANWKMVNAHKLHESKRSGKSDSATSAIRQLDNKTNKQQGIEHKYIASKNSKVFHKAGCRLAERINKGNLIGFGNREEAIKSGRRPCKVCKP